MKVFNWSRNGVIGYLVLSIICSVLLHLGNDFDINLLKVFQTWVTCWILPAVIFFNVVFREVK